MRHLEEYPDRDVMMLDLADKLTGELADALRRNDAVSFCVPGGTTPGPIFDVLSQQALDWDRVTVFLNDERLVPEDSPRSNARMLRERLFVSKASAAKFIPFFRAGQTVEEAAALIGEEIEPQLPISVLVLGMGADMHTASLFPDAPGLADALANHAPALMGLDGSGEPRISLTARVLNGAMSKHIVITGDDKRAALDRAAHLPATAAPIRAVWSDATVHWAP